MEENGQFSQDTYLRWQAILQRINWPYIAFYGYVSELQFTLEGDRNEAGHDFLINKH